jgi:hypothetical protein
MSSERTLRMPGRFSSSRSVSVREGVLPASTLTAVPLAGARARSLGHAAGARSREADDAMAARASG